MVIFGPSIQWSGKKYSAFRFLFIRPSGFGLMDPPLMFDLILLAGAPWTIKVEKLCIKNPMHPLNKVAQDGSHCKY